MLLLSHVVLFLCPTSCPLTITPFNGNRSKNNKTAALTAPIEPRRRRIDDVVTGRHCFFFLWITPAQQRPPIKFPLRGVTFGTHSLAVGWCRMMWMIRPGGYSGRWRVRAMELSFGWVVAFLAEVRCCKRKRWIQWKGFFVSLLSFYLPVVSLTSS